MRLNVLIGEENCGHAGGTWGAAHVSKASR